MEILVYKNNIEKDYRTIAVIEWKNFEQKIKVRPEDYVFLLSSDEFNKFMELNHQLDKGSKG
jgi:hypothetical protein